MSDLICMSVRIKQSGISVVDVSKSNVSQLVCNDVLPMLCEKSAQRAESEGEVKKRY